MTTYSYPLYAGGAPAAVWCWLIAGIGAMCLALSISEVASAYPTSGAIVIPIPILLLCVKKKKKFMCEMGL